MGGGGRGDLLFEGLHWRVKPHPTAFIQAVPIPPVWRFDVVEKKYAYSHPQPHGYDLTSAGREDEGIG